MEYTEYVEFIYLNSHMSREEIFENAKDLFNQGVSKYEALKILTENK